MGLFGKKTQKVSGYTTTGGKVVGDYTRPASTKERKGVNAAKLTRPAIPALPPKQPKPSPLKTPGVVFHGTTDEAAHAIAENGFRSSINGNIGRGVYATPDPGFASTFAKPGDKKQSTTKRVGTVLGIRVTGEPIHVKDDPISVERAEERTYRPDQMGEVVHVQNAYRTSAERSADRRAGLPPHPDTGPVRPQPVPVTQLPLEEIRRRIREKKTPPLPEM